MSETNEIIEELSTKENTNEKIETENDTTEEISYTEEPASEKSPRLTTLFMLTARIVVGAYVIYLAGDIFKNRGSGDVAEWVSIVFPLIFAILGTIFIISSLVLIVMGKYQGGKLDPKKNSDTDTDDND